MTTLVWLGGVLAALWFLGLLLSRHIQGLLLLVSGSSRVATATYDMLVLPGVVVHELSHVVVALLLGIRVLRVNLFQFRGVGDTRQGEIVVAKVDPLRMSLVGAAPLLGGAALLLLLVRWLDPPPLALDLEVFAQLRTLLSHWSTALVLYLLFAIANTMFPSEADRTAWWIVGLVVAVVVAFGALLGVQPALPPRWVSLAGAQAETLTAALLPVIVIDVLILVCVLLLEMLVGRVRGRRVVYRTLR